MVSKKEIKMAAIGKGKKISKEAVEKIEELLKEKMEEILNMSLRKANYSGRKIIKKEDIAE